LKRKVSFLEGIINQMSDDFNRRIQALEMSAAASGSHVVFPQAPNPVNTGMNSHYARTSNPNALISSLPARNKQSSGTKTSSQSKRGDVTFQAPPLPSSFNPMVMPSSTIPSTSTLPPHPKQKSSLPVDLDDQTLKEISLLRGVSTLGAFRGLSIESLGLDDASTHLQNESNAPVLGTPQSGTSNRNIFSREQSTFSLSLDAPVPEEA